MRGMGNMQGMMKQMQKMQKDMTKAQDELNASIFTGSSTNDLVKVTFTGDKKMQGIEINPELIDPEDPEMLQDMLVLAVNDAMSKINQVTESTMGKYTKGLPGF
ncbi:MULTISPECIES: YbaB/EbfC family nucleoid-associated protein [Enterococcus]|uniref:Nucleoid-associated protein KUA55_01220 n=1 Tax=Enterococcus alishanensis TaxID=1303817 RepID=A0ABS6T8R3_9ENTE|nr:YbaB/EbfC family nucleoid-associated protein [Enterococcus alishanensis]MBV7389285.1 YbaB/EbfC family nucleoid-associated protein [Enterococcus alishanensis]